MGSVRKEKDVSNPIYKLPEPLEQFKKFGMDQKLQVLVSPCVKPRSQKFENIPVKRLGITIKNPFCVHFLMLVSLTMTKETNESRSHC